MTARLLVTRIIHSCALLEFEYEDVIAAVLTDPWFRPRRLFGLKVEPGLAAEELPPLDAIIGSHYYVNHWDIRALAGHANRRCAQIYSATEGMARKARRAGFRNVAKICWGEQRNLKGDLILEAVEAHRGWEGATNSYVLSIPGLRVFFGGEARDLEPLRVYRRKHPPIDILLAPINGGHLLGRKLVMEPEDVLKAADILGVSAVIPIHDTADEPFIVAVGGGASELARLASARNAGPTVHCLALGESWKFESRVRSTLRDGSLPAVVLE